MSRETSRAKLMRGFDEIPQAILGDGFDEFDETISPIYRRHPVVHAFTKIIQESVDPKTEIVIPHSTKTHRRIESVEISGDWFSVREVRCGALLMYKAGRYHLPNAYPVSLHPDHEVRVVVYNRSKHPRLVTVTIKGAEVK